MAIGSRRVIPTSPVVAAVVSEAIVAFEWLKTDFRDSWIDGRCDRKLGRFLEISKRMGKNG